MKCRTLLSLSSFFGGTRARGHMSSRKSWHEEKRALWSSSRQHWEKITLFTFVTLYYARVLQLLRLGDALQNLRLLLYFNSLLHFIQVALYRTMKPALLLREVVAMQLHSELVKYTDWFLIGSFKLLRQSSKLSFVLLFQNGSTWKFREKLIWPYTHDNTKTTTMNNCYRFLCLWEN